MPVPGAASITDGILISLANLKTKTLNDDETVTIGAGLRWREVYEYVSDYGLAVCGGRFGDVGVGGLLLGGGISHFESQYGFLLLCHRLAHFAEGPPGARLLDQQPRLSGAIS